MAQRASVDHSAKLASVEWQCVLQHLDAVSILRAARCSRAINAAARQPFAWRSLPFAIKSIPKIAVAVSRLPSVRAVVPMSATWTIEVDLQPSSFDLVLNWLNSVHLRHLTVDSISALCPDQWTSLLSQRCMQHLRHLEARGSESEHNPVTTLKLISERMPRLESLSLFLHVPHDTDVAALWSHLVLVQGLHTLSLEFSESSVQDWLIVLEHPELKAPEGVAWMPLTTAKAFVPFAHLTRLPALTSLRLAARGMPFDLLRSMAPVGLPLLRTLILEGVRIDPGGLPLIWECATAESAGLPLAEQVLRLLPSLTHLRMDRSLHADQVLTAISKSSASSLASLVKLTLQPHSNGFFDHAYRSLYPSVSALASVLQHQPALVVELVISVSPRLTQMKGVQSSIAGRRKEWTQSEVLQPFRDRIQVI